MTNSEPITFEAILKAKTDIETKYSKIPSTLKMSQKTFNYFYDYVFEDRDDVEIDKTKDRPYDPRTTVFGILLEIDNDMKYGEWKFET